jgi:signal peptidase II
MRTLSRLFLVATLLVACTGCDQVTKVYARSHLSPGVTSSYLHDSVRIIYSENVGAFLGSGASLPKHVRTAIFQGGVALLVLGLLAAALSWRGLGRWQVAGLALLAASGLGNLIDRVLYDGRVTDFLNVGIGPLRTGIFNVADVCGVVALAILLLHDRVAAPDAASASSRRA